MTSKKGRFSQNKAKKSSYDTNDAYTQKARREGFVARSVYKLEDIDRRHKLYRQGMKVLDLGCAPGSWLQYAAHRIGSSGIAIGFDLNPVRVELKNVKTYVKDIFDLSKDSKEVRDCLPFDLIQSDAMSKTTGIPETDCARSIDLVEFSIHLASQGFLVPSGNLLAKVFEGPGFTEFLKNFRSKFNKIDILKPPAIRKGSREVYVLGIGWKGE